MLFAFFFFTLLQKSVCLCVCVPMWLFWAMTLYKGCIFIWFSQKSQSQVMIVPENQSATRIFHWQSNWFADASIVQSRQSRGRPVQWRHRKRADLRGLVIILCLRSLLPVPKNLLVRFNLRSLAESLNWALADTCEVVWFQRLGDYLGFSQPHTFCQEEVPTDKKRANSKSRVYMTHFYSLLPVCQKFHLAD